MAASLLASNNRHVSFCSWRPGGGCQSTSRVEGLGEDASLLLPQFPLVAGTPWCSWLVDTPTTPVLSSLCLLLCMCPSLLMRTLDLECIVIQNELISRFLIIPTKTLFANKITFTGFRWMYGGHQSTHYIIHKYFSIPKDRGLKKIAIGPLHTIKMNNSLICI